MSPTLLYPLFFEPLYQYRLWGGRRLAALLKAPLPDGPIGEAWILSDRDEHMSLVSNGALQGQTIHQLMERFPQQMMGALQGRFARFPLLLKFLDAQQMLSVQVHPSDAYPELIPTGDSAKTEAWVVLEADAKSHIYAGLKDGTTRDNLQASISDGTLESHLVGFTPKPGDGVFIQAGTVHSLGGGVVVFEVQQNSDVTFRLYDWNHVDAKTGKPRELQVDQALACINFEQGEVRPVSPCVETCKHTTLERLFDCQPFSLWRLRGDCGMFEVGVHLTPRILVCIEGAGQLEHNGIHYPVEKGNVVLLPAVVGACPFRPLNAVTLLEIALPEFQPNEKAYRL
jgi:mannose-6-phosphate isomerase